MLIAALIAFQVVVFFALIIMLRKILTKNVVSATRHIDELNQDYMKKEEEANRLLDDARQKSEEMIAKAQQEAAGAKEAALREVEAEKEKLITQARAQSVEIIQQADRSRQLLLSEITDRISKEGVVKAVELIEQVLPEKFRQEAHSHWAEELIDQGFSQLENLRVPSDVRDVVVRTPFTLTDAQRKGVAKKLKDILGREMALKEEIDPKVVAGITITIGSLVLDGSLKNKIQERAKSASA